MFSYILHHSPIGKIKLLNINVRYTRTAHKVRGKDCHMFSYSLHHSPMEKRLLNIIIYIN